jgi:CubicO group peptidase (beta-lactamase class C family)
MLELDAHDLQAKVAEVLDRWPSAGLAVGVIRDGSLEWFLGHGVADIASKEPITPDTVFRIGSLTKTFTAIAVMQLWEQGLVDLDAPANDYLRAFRLIPAKTSFRPATVRHLLTHTAGVGYWRRLSDLLQPGVGSGDRAGRSGAPPLADYYRRGLAGGDPAGHQVGVQQPRVRRARPARRGHRRARRGAQARHAGLDVPTPLPADPRVPGMGLGFEPGEESGHATVAKAGILSGFHSAMLLAPDDGLGVVVFTNIGGLDGRGAPEPLAVAVLRRLPGRPDEVVRTDIPVRPETWSAICG